MNPEHGMQAIILLECLSLLVIAIAIRNANLQPVSE